MELPEAGGLYGTGNVTYRGFEVGRVESVRLTDTGVEAVLSLKSGIDIPSDLKAEVHSHTAIGESYVELLPRNATSPPLKDGDVIPLADTSVPPDINALLSAANTALEAIPRDNLKTVVDESYTAVGGLGPELSRLIMGTSDLAIDARKNLDPLIALIDQAQPVLDSQTHTSDAIAGWASHLATVTTELQTHDAAVGGVIDQGGPALGEMRQLIERVQPTLPILLANLVSVGQVALTYQNDIEQLLVVFPMAISRRTGRHPGQPEHQAGISGSVSELQPQPQPAAALHHRIPAGPTAAHPHVRGLPGPPGRRSVLPGPAGFAAQCARRPQHPVRNRARQARTHREVVREQRTVRAAQRRLQLEGRPQRHACPVRTSRSCRPGRHRRPTGPPGPRRRRHPSPPPSTTRPPAPIPDPTAISTRDPTWRKPRRKTRRGKRCCCHRGTDDDDETHQARCRWRTVCR